MFAFGFLDLLFDLLLLARSLSDGLDEQRIRPLLTFALLNVGMGIAMGIITALLGIPNAFLWATLVAILNCVPYVGPLVSMAILTVAGFASAGRRDTKIGPEFFLSLGARSLL